MSPPTVSVVMPVFNRERFVGEAVQSILSQTFANLELIVVDDGSTDRTSEILRSFADPRLHVIRQENRGIGAAMNTGLRAVRGEYVARLDSDDVWLPDMLEAQLRVLEAHPHAGLVYARAQGMEHDGTPHHSTWGIPQRYPDDSLRSMLYGDCTCNITIVARRACFERGGLYDESLATGEDWDLWLRVARHYPFAFNDRVVARFRWHEDNITGPNSPHYVDSLDGRVRVLDKFFSQPDLPAPITAMKPVAYQNLHVGTGLLWLGRRELRRALRSFGKAVRQGGNPPVTLLRIAWFVLSWEVLGKFPLGRRFVAWQAATRRRWREER